ncbi:acyl-CoA N-acyltransferase [Hygrophoropsis aurantiaca]|uniref:Acyl-CoA N-acyltransferase n=1 Tax=Hygrophoropsis aurantiaca TaxID=72124 RepID=A0ACB8AJK2_9AGAM|nr:acyl-CoA N-acyltransferase [Hygrophoropsis aurantiaca]
MFTTDRLVLRAFRDDDLDHLLALRNDPRVVTSLSAEPVVPRPPNYKIFLKELAENSTIGFTITIKETGQFMGQCSIKATEPQKNRDALFGISMYPDFWGKGYGREATKFTIDYAFKALGLQRVSLMVSAENTRAISLYEKLGFSVEGRKRRANWVNGHWEDTLSMGVLQEEWAALHA